MRISFQLPERFASLSVGTQHWSVVEAEAREAIEWVDKNESCLEGWFVGTYAFFICSLIQCVYFLFLLRPVHTINVTCSCLGTTRTFGGATQPRLRPCVSRETASRYANPLFRLPVECCADALLQRLVVPDGECYVRAKIAEIIHLLYHTACSVARWAPEAAEGMSPASSGTTAVTTLNPTAGVRQR